MTGTPGTPEIAAVATVGAVLTDLIDVAERLPVPPAQAEATARILDRLAEEITEAASMLRGGPAAALPAWAADQRSDDERVTWARTLLAEHHQPIAMSPGELRKLLARFQRRTFELLEVIDGDQR